MLHSLLSIEHKRVNTMFYNICYITACIEQSYMLLYSILYCIDIIHDIIYVDL